MKQRFLTAAALCGLLAAALLVLPAAAHDDSDIPYAVTGGNLWFEELSGSIMECDYYVTRAVVPPQINGVPVTAIGNYAFAYSSIERVELPDTITKIRPDAFMNCNGLTTISLPDSVEYIGDGAFRYCGGLRRLTFPDRVTVIPATVLCGCGAMLSVTIPAGVTEIQEYAFDGCSQLEDVYYAGTKAQWNAIKIADGNEELLSAALHTESEGPAAPSPASLSFTLSAPVFGVDLPLTVTGAGTRTVRFVTAFYDENHRFLGLETTSGTVYPGLQSVFVPVREGAFVPDIKAVALDEDYRPLTAADGGDTFGGTLDDRYAAILSEPDADRRAALTDALTEREAKAFIEQFAGWFH